MADRLHPGVYLEEVPGGARPIEGVGTSTAAFIGIAEKGRIDEAVLITNWTAFQTEFGSFIKDSDLAYAVYHFFLNGGKKCYVVRVNHGESGTSSKMLLNDDLEKTLKIQAASPGTWGNRLKISILPGMIDPVREFSMKVWEKDNVVEQFHNISMVDSEDNYVEKMINRISKYITVEDQLLDDNAIFTGTVDLINRTIDMQNIKYIKLQIDEHSPPKIDCSKKDDPANTTILDIITAINEAFSNLVGGEVAFLVEEDAGGQYIELRSPSTGAGSQIIFTPPLIADVTEDIFGVVEYSWRVTSLTEKEKMVEIRGTSFDLPGLIAISDNDDYPIKDGENSLNANFSSADSFQKVIDAINSIHTGLAGTDGENLILRSGADIEIPNGTDSTGLITTALFGDKIYSIAKFGGENTSATFQSVGVNFNSIAIGDNQRILSIKINDYPCAILDVASEVPIGGDYSTVKLDTIISNINEQYKNQTGKKKDIATPNDTNNDLVIKSPTTGTASRIVISYSGEKDCGKVLFGNTITGHAEGYLFVAETYKNKPARVTGKNIISPIDFDNNPNRMRFSVDDNESKDRKFTGTLSSINIAKQINKDLDEKVARIEYPDVNTHRLIIESPTRGINSNIYLSIPLDNNLVHDPDLNALTCLFDSNTISGLNTVQTPQYRKIVLPSNNRPQLTEVELPGIGKEDSPLPLFGGTQNHEEVSDEDVLGQSGISGIKTLDVKDDVNLICIPGEIGQTSAQAIMRGGMAYCETRSLQDCFFIADMPKEYDTPDTAKYFVQNVLTKKSDFGAIYYPWITVADPNSASGVRKIPPCGLVAGMYARIDGTRGVWKAPAGTEANLSGVVALVYKTTDTEQDILNPFGINCIRQFPGSGVVIWGSRTLGLKSKPQWKYIPVRRMAIFLRVSLFNGIQWAVFEPNDEDLWASLRLNINAFMLRLFRQGAFQGDTPSKAFFVKCDSETTIQADIDAGVVNILVGFAPLKPAEFVILKLSQKAGHSAA